MAVITSKTGARSWNTATDWVGDTLPVDNVDSVVIAADCQMLMNQDQSAYTDGMLGVTVEGHATTPGMLYWADGTSGHLKIKTGFNLLGTTGTLKGRVLANSDGVWGNTGSLAFADKAVIDLGATSTIDARYLDLAFYGYNAMPNKYLRTYGVRHTVTADSGADTLTKVSHGLANATPVMIMSSGAIPAPLEADFIYYVVNTTADTFQLASTSGGVVIDLTDAGSGTIEVYTGAADGASPVNVFEDVSAETGWTTAAGHNRVVIADIGPVTSDQQRLTITAIASGTITLSEVLDSLQYPGARIGLSSRNVSIRSATVTTATNIVNYSNNTSSAGVFQCEIIATAGTAGTFYGYGIYQGTGHTISGAISGCSTGVYAGTSHTISGTILACGSGVDNLTSATISGLIMGCGAGVRDGSLCNISGFILGNGTQLTGGTRHTISGVLAGGNNGGFFVGAGHILSGTMKSAGWGMWYGMGHTVTSTGRIIGCGNAIRACAGTIMNGTINGCTIGLNQTSGNVVGGAIVGCGTAVYRSLDAVITGRIGYDLDGVDIPNTTDFRFGGTGDDWTLRVTCRGAWLPASPVFGGRNSSTNAGVSKQGVWCEDFGLGGAPVLGASRAYLPVGDVIKNTVTVRPSGSASSLEVVPTSGCGPTAFVFVSEWTELAVPASLQNKSVYVKGEGWTTWPTADELYLEAEYVSNATTFARTTVKSTEVLTDNTTWVQLTTGNFTPANAAHVRYRVWLKKYEAASKVYVDNALYG